MAVENISDNMINDIIKLSQTVAPKTLGDAVQQAFNVYPLQNANPPQKLKSVTEFNRPSINGLTPDDFRTPDNGYIEPAPQSTPEQVPKTPVIQQKPETQPTATDVVNSEFYQGAKAERDNFNNAQAEKARNEAVIAALQAQRAARQNNPFAEYSKTSDEYYNDAYRHFRNNGYSDSEATRMAGDLAAKYQARMLSSFANNFSYGVNNDGSLNGTGAYLIQRMGIENPGMANMFGNLYALPKQQYSTNVAQTTAEANYQRRLEEIARRAEAREAVNAANLQNKQAYNNAMIAARYEMAKQMNLPEEEARKFAYGVGYGQQRQTGTAKTKQQAHADFGYDSDTNKVLRSMTDLKNKYDKRFSDLRTTKDSKQREALIAETGEILSEIDDLFTKAESYISEDDRKAFRLWHYNANKSRDKAAGY